MSIVPKQGYGRQPSRQLLSLGSGIVDSMADRIAVLDTMGNIVAVNDAWSAFAIACRADLAATCEGANYLAICERPMGDDVGIAHHVARSLREVISGTRHEFIAEYPCHGPEPSQQAWFEIRATPFQHNGSRFITVSHSDRTTRVKAERERERAGRMIARLRILMRRLYQTQSRLRRAQDAAGIVAFEMDLHGAPLNGPDALQHLLGLSSDAQLNSDILLASVHAADRPALAAAFSRLAAEGGSLRHEFRRASPTGDAEWIQLIGIGDSISGPPYRFVGVARDITERRRAEEQREMLAREIEHRAANVFAVVQAVLRLSRPKEGGAYVEALEGRIAALARAHASLSEGNWAAADLYAIVEGEVEPYRGAEGPVIRIEGASTDLEPNTAQSLALVIHELTTNSAKHGALSRSTGQLLVSWHVDDFAKQLMLCWRERGGPMIAGAPKRCGFGSRVIASMVRDQLGGSLVQNWEPEGLIAEIAVPLVRDLDGEE